MPNDYLLSLPILAAAGWSVLLIILEATLARAALTRVFAMLGFALVGGLSVIGFPLQGFAFSEMLRIGGFQHFANIVFCLSGLLVVALSEKYLDDENVHYGEYYIVAFISVVGMMLLAASANMAILFIGLEMMSIALYVLAGLMRRDVRSNEAAMKYFLLGAFASGLLLYGISLIYGATGELALHKIAIVVQTGSASMLFWIGFGLLITGFLFKISAVPFHQWTPDVYDGSPTPAAAFMSTGAKAAAFSALIVVVTNFSTLLQNSPTWSLVISYISLATMVIGNVTALAQESLKRMLAYSSVAHAGYMLVGIAAATPDGYSGIMFYTLVYTLMNIGAFGVVALLESKENLLLASDYAGLFKHRPMLAGAMAVFMLSLAGVPPLGGFIGKYKVFAAAVDAKLTWLALAGVLASAVSAYYYLRVVYFMFMRDPVGEAISAPATSSIAFALIAVAVVLLGIFPTEILRITDAALKFAQLPTQTGF